MADYKKAEEQAKEVWKQNFILSVPFDLEEIARNYGLEVVEVDFGEKFSNIAGYLKEKTIFVNGLDGENRKKFTIAHELGHFLLHQKELEEHPSQYAVLFRITIGKMNNDPVEKEANCFAANLLVPEEMLREKLTQKIGIPQLAEIFGVSQDVIGYRIQILHSNHSNF